MHNPMKLLIGRAMDDDSIKVIQKKFPWLEIETCETEEEQDAKLPDTSFLFTRILPKKSSLAPKLKWVQFMFEGVESLSEEFRDSDIILTNASGAHAAPLAEHVFTFMLNHERQTFMYLDQQKRKEWLYWWNHPKLGLLREKTIGIIGYGQIGRAIACIARGFGMTVLALKRNPGIKQHDDFLIWTCCDREGSVPEVIFGPDGLYELLARSDHVVLALPLTEETRKLIGKEAFTAMKAEAFFINIGRGDLVDEDALIEALEMKKISGAGLDVFKKEPLPAESPLWTMENVIITPHAGVGGDPADDKIIQLFCENLQRFLDGEKMINLVDKKRGY